MSRATDASADTSVPGPLLRAAAMIYEAVLLFGVSFIVGYALLAALRWTHPLAPHQRWTVQAVLFVAYGAYFVVCWTRGGQTLAMKSWHLRLVGPDGSVSLRTAMLRYLLAWTLFVPGLIFIALAQAPAVVDALAMLLGILAMLSAGRLRRDRQLLHDRLLGTRVIRVPPRQPRTARPPAESPSARSRGGGSYRETRPPRPSP